MAANGHATKPGAGWAAPKYEVQVKSERFKFNAAHFVAFPGYRERLHGHNYTCSVRVFGPLSENDGYVLDFGDVKKATRRVCEALNERFLCPCLADALAITRNEKNVEIVCEDSSFFSMPEDDCAMLPLKHSTAEELAALVWRRVIDELGVEKLVKRGTTALEVSVAEAPSQEARYTRPLAGYDPREEVVVKLPSPGACCSAFAVRCKPPAAPA